MGVRSRPWPLAGLLVLVLVLTLSWAVVAAADPGPSYFSGDDTSDSYGGAGLTWDGTPGYGTGHTGAAGDRAFVVGPNGVLVANDATLGNFGTRDFTLHLFVRFPAAGSQRAQVLSKRGDCTSGSFLDLRAGTSFGGVHFEIQDAANFGFNVTNPADLFDDAWHEITATRAGTRVTLTVDGVTASATSNGVVNVDNGTPLRLGDGGCAGTLGDGTTRALGSLDAISFGPGTEVIGPPAPPTTTPTPPPATPAPTAAPESSEPAPPPARPSRTSESSATPVTPTSTPSPSSTPAPTPSPAPSVTPAPTSTPAPVAGPDPTVTQAQPVIPQGSRPEAGVEFARSVPPPTQVSTDLATIAQNALLAVLLLALLALPIGVINDTAKENADWFAAWAARVRRLRNAVVVVWSRRLRFGLGLVAAALAGAVIYSFVEPTFGLDLSSLALVLGLAAAFLVVSFAKELSQFLYLGRAYNVRGYLRLFPAFACVGVICVTVSRAVGLEPGLILGTLAALGTQSELSVKQKGRAATVSACALAVTGVLAWVLRGELAEGPGFTAQILEVALTAIAVAAAENLAFGLLPLSFLDGAALFAWSKPAWAGFSLLGAFAFVHVLLHRDAGTFGERVAYLAVLLAVYFTLAAVFWTYFRVAERRRVRY